MTNQSNSVSLNFTFRNLEGTEAIKKYASEKFLHVLSKFVHKDTEAHVVFKVEKSRQIAEISFNNQGTYFKGSEESADLYKAIDALADSIEQQLRKHKDKLISRH